MDKKELKEKLYRQIEEMEDEQALHMLHEAAVEYGRMNETEELTPAQLERLKKSQEQCRAGNTHTHEEVQKIVEAWLTK